MPEPPFTSAGAGRPADPELAVQSRAPQTDISGVTAGGPFRPILALPYWDEIGAFVEATVTETASVTGRELRGLYAAITPFVLWCWQARGLSLRREKIFRAPLVDLFIHARLPDHSPASRATLRASLRRAVEVLNPQEGPRSFPLPRSEPTEPYSPGEVADLVGWVNGQATDRRRRDASALLALGLGCGLTTTEILETTIQEVTLDPVTGNAAISVWERRPRVVPVMRAWVPLLARAIHDGDASSWVFRPGRTSVSPGQITDFLLRSRTDLDIRPSRMRATWIVRHLTAGTPAQQLLHLAGLKHLAALDKYTAFAPKTRATWMAD